MLTWRTLINAEHVDHIRAAHGWTWAEVARRAGESPSHFSEIRKGTRKVNLTFILCLAVGIETTWEKLLKPVPKIHSGLSAREILGINKLEDGRRWPVQRGEDEGAMRSISKYRRWLNENQLGTRV